MIVIEQMILIEKMRSTKKGNMDVLANVFA